MDARLLIFLQDPSKPVDETTSFDFETLLFNTDSATLPTNLGGAIEPQHCLPSQSVSEHLWEDQRIYRPVEQAGDGAHAEALLRVGIKDQTRYLGLALHHFE